MANLVNENLFSLVLVFINTFSIMYFDAPYTLSDKHALSVLTPMVVVTLFMILASTTFKLPITFILQPMIGLVSIKSMCFIAAAWITTSGLTSLNILMSDDLSSMLPT